MARTTGIDMGNFDRESRRASQRVVLEATEAIRAVAIDAYSSLQAEAATAQAGGSPVASGRLASSMRVGINSIDTSTAPADPNYQYPRGRGPRPLPSRTIRNNPISRVSALLRTYRLGDTIYISNSVPYIRRIEVGGHSWQTPEGVFDPTIRAVLARFRNARVRVFRV